MKKTIVGAFALLALAGCGAPPGGNTNAFGTTEQRVALADGTSVDCIFWNGQYNGGISCDWEHKS